LEHRPLGRCAACRTRRITPMSPTPLLSMHRPRSPLRFWMAGLVLLLALTRLGLWAAELQSPVRPEFALPQPGRIFQFPADHGSHPEFKIEWWYITGHLTSEGGQRHGFQATFFRRAGDRRANTNTPSQSLTPPTSATRATAGASCSLAKTRSPPTPPASSPSRTTRSTCPTSCRPTTETGRPSCPKSC
jgi:hypothetical protein